MTATLYDDDDQYLQHHDLFPSVLNLPSPPLPAEGLAGEIVTQIAPRYADAYILPVNANAMGWNTVQRIPFRRNADSGDASVFNNGNLQLIGTDRPEFWAFSVIMAYQYITKEDGDPDKEGFTLGLTDKSLNPFNFLGARGWSVIFTEIVRDEAFSETIQTQPQAFAAPVPAAALRLRYNRLIYGTVAHEIGHAPGRQTPEGLLGRGGDHGEGGLMRAGAHLITERFSSPTIRRFRKTDKWTGQ